MLRNFFHQIEAFTSGGTVKQETHKTKLGKCGRHRKFRKLQDYKALLKVINAVNNSKVNALVDLPASWKGSSRNAA